MATRRPKVPKAAARTPSAADAAKDAAEVIRADFGGTGAASGAGRGTAGGAKDKPAAPKVAAGAKAKAGAGATRVSGKAAVAGAAAKKDDPTHDDAHPVPAKAFSGRMLALAVVMIAITIMLAPTVKIFFDKRAELAALSADIEARQAEQDVLRQQLSRWQDPNYVKQQARDRINMVMPGESGYWVFGSDLPAGTSSSQTATAAQDPADLPWVDSLWESIRRAATD
ncbi:FtsB family cell division protein [Arthrobacter sp. HMWF013]|uniref:FtsB family cell division protein n=1 Tax=Arthrobacter sp. HMWF013 TaxID=2056849 RepID=UPI000D348395|nr:septum formation initiator family protein [Arthrobacter sp. HMWF013]PTT67551.1 septation ring formation regulator EzrA [Arthrobacter sp. HMWF013]